MSFSICMNILTDYIKILKSKYLYDYTNYFKNKYRGGMLETHSLFLGLDNIYT